MRTRRLIPVFLGLVIAAAAVAVGVYLSLGDDSNGREGRESTPELGFAVGPEPWPDADPQRDGTFHDDGTLAIGSLELPPPLPSEATDVSWERSGPVATGQGTIRGESLKAVVRGAEHNSNIAFAARTELGLEKLNEAIVSEIRLPLGEVSYVNPAYEEVAFAGKEVVLPSMSTGPITWRNGDVELHLWQWQVDRVALRPAEDGETIVELTWWSPEQHPVPEECIEELTDVTISVEIRGMISFGPLPSIARSRLPGGVTSAVVPVFHDPRNHPDARFKDALSTGASDYARRARTLALGHSSPEDARHGNGGLIGAGVGGTIVVPHEWADAKALEPLREDLAETTVHLVDEAQLRPVDCAGWKEAIDKSRPVVGSTEEFDGRIPNLLHSDWTHRLPSTTTAPIVWPATQLTGRRKDVVQQAMSSTYLDRLAARRGLSVLMVPIIASRNPLVAVAAESLLEPESNGHWTIQEELARAFAGIELLGEENQVDLLSLERLNDYLLASRKVEIHPRLDGTFGVANTTDRRVSGFTLVVGGAVHPLVDDEPPQHAIREVGGGAKQTWIWWDLAPKAEHVLRLERPDAASPLVVSWSPPKGE
jgi:hypothetical protein